MSEVEAYSPWDNGPGSCRPAMVSGSGPQGAPLEGSHRVQGIRWTSLGNIYDINQGTLSSLAGGSRPLGPLTINVINDIRTGWFQG